MRFKIKKGLDLPIQGAPVQELRGEKNARQVAVLGPDHVGMKPTMMVREDDRVKLGQPLFTDKKTPGVVHTAPAAGRVVAVNRGAKRVLQSVVIAVDGEDAVHFKPLGAGATRAQVRDLLVQSGLWTALRTRPFSRVAAPDGTPGSIFVNAMDSSPLAPDARVALAGREDDLAAGVKALQVLGGKVHVCTRPGVTFPGLTGEGIHHHEFEGPHPAGLVGTHIHFVDPVSASYEVWHLDAQDAAAIGRLVREGRIDDRRVVSIAGPAARDPRLVRVPVGASIAEICAGEVPQDAGAARLVSGSVLCGRTASGELADRLGYLGRFHNTVSILPDAGEREFLGWHMPGANKYSIKNVFVSALQRGKKRFSFDTSMNGSHRAMVPVGAYESVMPLDIEATFLLRSLLTRDTDRAQLLGALELDEEDMGLCTFVSPGKEEYGMLLRENLTLIERNG